MYEEEVIEQLKRANVGLVLSLPCDKNKGFTDLVHEKIHTVDLTKEEDGVGIAAGAYMAGTRSVISIQSSGLGNMMNAIMSLTDCYGLPLAVLASWRGTEDEKIEAQKHFNPRIPEMLDVFGIKHIEISEASDIGKIALSIDEAYETRTIVVILIRPKMWEGSEKKFLDYPCRKRRVQYEIDSKIPEPSLSRLEAIKAVMEKIGDDVLVVSNIGVPSKEVYAVRDRPGNFYMMGSFGQATPIGLGLALCSKRQVVVIDGDGSLLTNNILPVVAAEKPDNLVIVCLDNGTYGSTGHQINPAYSVLDIGWFALGCGLESVFTVSDKKSAQHILAFPDRTMFLRFLCRPGNSASPNIPLSAVEIRDRFMNAIGN